MCVTSIKTGSLTPSSMPVQDLQLTRDPFRNKSVALITTKDSHALIQTNTLP